MGVMKRKMRKMRRRKRLRRKVKRDESTEGGDKIVGTVCLPMISS
jgi:hypothetical protein